MSKIAVTCHQCGQIIYRKASHANRPQKHFCNHACYSAYKRTLRGEKNPRTQQIEVTCFYCHQSFTIAPWEAERHKRHFHPKCYDDWRSRNTVEVSCHHCGKPIHKPASKIARGGNLFCSKECKGAWQSKAMRGDKHPSWIGPITVPCLVCGQPITRPHNRFKTNRAVCSKECERKWRSRKWQGANNPYWEGGRYPYYGDDWYEQRRQARARDNFTCQYCGITEAEVGYKLNVHHKIPRRISHSNSLDNLITLCRSCHIQAEWEYRQSVISS